MRRCMAEDAGKYDPPCHFPTYACCQRSHARSRFLDSTPPVRSVAGMKSIRTLFRTSALSLMAMACATILHAEPAPLKLKDNDVWVMVGDSITAQRLHSNYIELYYRTRHPELKLHFRNSGIGGNRTNHVLERFEYDIADWKPTIVSVELGMNDVNDPLPAYVNGMKLIIAKIRAIPATPILISSSPVDDGSKMNDWKGARCEKIHAFTEALQQLAAEENVLFVDQYHPLIDVWGDNRRKSPDFIAKGPQPEAGAGAKPADAKASSPYISLGGDAVHPGPVGQYTMAAVILKGLGAGGEVSTATISANGTVGETKGCKISDVIVKDGKLSFTRLDERGFWPVLSAGRAAFDLLPSGLELSQYILKVPGLAGGNYKVRINGRVATEISAEELAKGWNMTLAMGERSAALGKMALHLQSPLNNLWRKASKEGDAEKLAAAQDSIVKYEAELQQLVQPVPVKIEISK